MLEFNSMRYCLVCGSRKKYPICAVCKHDPFKIEQCRQILAKVSDLKLLKKMYTSSLAEIEDLNTSDFWDNKLGKIMDFNSQDGMTKERVMTAASYIPKNTQKILDIGAGYGFLEEILSNGKHDFEIYGIDISPKGINLLKKRFEGEFKVGAADKIPYPKNFFNVVLALELLEHISPSMTFNVLNEIRRVLVPNGVLVLSVPLNEGLKCKKDNPSGHVREYTKNLIKFELFLAGFKIVRCKKLFAFKNWYSFKKFLQRFLPFKRWRPNDIILKTIKL